MVLTTRETQSLLVLAWKASAKGRPMRWRILRDMVASLSLAWMTTMEIQIVMRRLYALKNNTTRDILEELEMERAVIQEKDDKTKLHKWGATRTGVDFWIVKMDRIPASIAQVVQSTVDVFKSEV